jgi:hypothetical protein
MPTPSTLRKRLQLTHDFEQLYSRLESGDAAAVEEAIEEARDIICGLVLCEDAEVLALVFRALVKVLDDMQQEIDHGGWQFK